MSFRIILHIGINKTGTSAIQRFFNDRYVQLIDLGVLYPKAGRQRTNHHHLSKLLGFGPALDLDVETQRRALADIKQELISEVSGTGAHTVIISSENFMLPRRMEPAIDFFSGFDVRPLVYLRRHDQWRESAYSQGLRMIENPAWKPGFEGWLEFHETNVPKYGDYRLLVDSWAEAFGKDRIIVRPYEKQQNQPGIVNDFLQSVALDEVTEKVDISVPRVNGSLSIKAMQLLEIFQRITDDPKKRQRLVKYACSMPAEQNRQSIVPPLLRRRLAEYKQSDYEYIAREYLGREDGRLFYDPLPDADQPWSPQTALSAEEIASLMNESPGSRLKRIFLETSLKLIKRSRKLLRRAKR